MLTIARLAGSLFAVVAIASVSAAHAMPGQSKAVQDVAVEFVALTGPGSGVDCDASAQPVARCRVRAAADVAMLETMLSGGHSVARAGDELVFAYRGEADSVQLMSGLWYPLSRVHGTDLWTLRVRVQGLDRLMTMYSFVAGGDYSARRTERIWRGPLAPSAPPVADPLRGSLDTHTIASEFLPAPRKLSIYTPPEVGGRPLAAVVYAADGQSLMRFARVIEPLITTGALPRVLLVGIHNAGGAQRSREYVPAYGRNNTAFPAHERFFVEELVPFVERTKRVPRSAMRVLFGYSNGADWALATALRHPDRFARVIALSPGWTMEAAPPDSLQPLAFFIGAGSLEGSYRRTAERIAARLHRDGLRHVYREEVAGHDAALWTQLMPEGLRWSLLER